MKNALLGCLLLVPGLACAQSMYPFVIKGKIGRLNAPAKVFLRHDARVDSATLKNGRFELRGTTSLPFPVDLVLERQGKQRDSHQGEGAYFVSPDRISVALEAGPIVITSPDSLRNARITGGSLTADYQRLRAIDAANDREPGTPEDRQQKYIQAKKAFIKENPTSWASLYALWQLNPFGLQYAEVAPLYEAFSPALRDSEPGRRYAEYLQKWQDPRASAPVASQPGTQLLGEPAPAFTLSTPEGRPVALADYRGKYVLVEFWASWCGPCRKENPALIQVYNTYRDHNFEVLGVSLDDEQGRSKWVKAIADDQLPWVQVSDLRGWKSQAALVYGVQGIPQNFLVDPTGKIVGVNLHSDELRGQLAKLIK